MSFIDLTKQFFERSTITLRPSVKFISSSMGGGVTGSEFVAPVRSKCIKDPNTKTQLRMDNYK